MEATSPSSVPWKAFVKTTSESILAFYIATFCLGMYFLHRSPEWWQMGIVLGLLYSFVIIVCAKRVFENLSLAAIMLITPIAPLIALIIVVTLIPILEMFS
jgi:hypothetical protein